MITITMDADGPLFDGEADAAVDRMLEDAKDDIGAAGLAHVHTTLDARIVDPTPYYETQVMKQRLGGAVVVHDRDIVYGRWLEGISSRNAETDFKGYHAFASAAAALNAGEAQQLLERQVALHLPEMGG